MAEVAGNIVNGLTTTYSSTHLLIVDGYWVRLEGSPDAFGPVVSNIVPTPSANLAASHEAAVMTQISFDVTDVTENINKLIITIKYVDEQEIYVVYHTDLGFVYPFDSGVSMRTNIDLGYHFVIRPREGWRRSIDSLRVYAVDALGNENS
jgi:hypothetical protein